MRDAMLSLPPRRPPTIHNSFTRLGGGSRWASWWKVVRSSVVIGMANAPFRMARQASQDWPENHWPKRRWSSNTFVMGGVGKVIWILSDLPKPTHASDQKVAV